MTKSINKLLKSGRKKKKKKLSKSAALRGAPCIGGIVEKKKKVSPKKPNSALRSIFRVRFNNGDSKWCYIRGEGNSVQEHETVLVMGGGPRDLPGVNYRVIRGRRSAAGVEGRKNGRSKYGAKLPKLEG